MRARRQAMAVETHTPAACLVAHGCSSDASRNYTHSNRAFAPQVAELCDRCEAEGVARSKRRRSCACGRHFIDVRRSEPAGGCREGEGSGKGGGCRGRGRSGSRGRCIKVCEEDGNETARAAQLADWKSRGGAANCAVRGEHDESVGERQARACAGDEPARREARIRHRRERVKGCVEVKRRKNCFRVNTVAGRACAAAGGAPCSGCDD